MNNKKLFGFFCATAFVMSLALTGCFGSKKNNNTSSASQEESSSEQGGNESSSQVSSQTSSQTSSSETVKEWTVTFDSQGGSKVASQKVKNGEKATKPVDPTRDNFTFDGWFEEADAITEFDFSTKITTNWTLYAGWTENQIVPPDPPEPPVEEYDFYVQLGDSVYGAVKQSYDLAETQVAEYRVDVGHVVAGQSIAILNSDKVALTDSYGSEPGNNNVEGEAGAFTIHNDADDAFVLVKTWESGWTNFYVSGYDSGIPQPTEGFYAVINDVEYPLEKQTYDLAETQVAEYRADVGNVLAGQTIQILNGDKVELSEDFGAEPGNNNVVGTVGDFTIRNDAEDVFVIVKTWESGWTNFYVSGYEKSTPSGAHGPEGSVLVDWYIVGEGSIFEDSWSIDGGVQLYSNPDALTDKGCILSLTIEAGDTFKVTDGTSWFGYEKVDQWDDVANLGRLNFSGVNDGYGGQNIHCDVTGTYDIYVNGSGQFWIQAAVVA